MGLARIFMDDGYGIPVLNPDAMASRGYRKGGGNENTPSPVRKTDYYSTLPHRDDLFALSRG